MIAAKEIQSPQNIHFRMPNFAGAPEDATLDDLGIPPEERAAIDASHASDDASRKMGFKGAPVGGDISHACRAAMRSWGRDWLTRGAVDIQYRRPMFGGDEVALEFSALRSEDGVAISDFSMSNGPDATCWKGSVRLPSANATDIIDHAAFPFVDPSAPMPDLAEAATLIGTPLPTQWTCHSTAFAAAARAEDFDLLPEPDVKVAKWAWRLINRHLTMDIIELKNAFPWIIEEEVLPIWHVHPTMPEKKGGNFSMQTGVALQFHGLPKLGEKLEWRSRIADAFERKGSKFAVIEFLALAQDGSPLATRQCSLMYDFAGAPTA